MRGRITQQKLMSEMELGGPNDLKKAMEIEAVRPVRMSQTHGDALMSFLMIPSFSNVPSPERN